MKHDQLNVAIIGCGAISKKHIDGIRANSDTLRIAGVFDIDGDRAAAAAEETGAPAFTDMDRMAAGLSPDVVAIATPSALHAEQAIFWMDRGAHIVLEKPIALSTVDIARIRDVADRSGRTIVVGYVLRYAPHIRLLAKAIEHGRFGRILHAGLTIYWNRNDDYFTSAPWRGTWQHDGGTLMNQATHGIDLLQWLLGGRPTVISGTLARHLRPIEADDFAAATVQFENGAIGTIATTVDAYPKNLGTRLTILGEHGTVELSGNGPDAITTWRFPEDADWAQTDAALAAGSWSPEASGIVGRSGHAGVYEDLVAALNEKRQPIAGIDSSAVSVEIVLGIQKSHRDGRPVSIPFSFASRQMTGVRL